MSSSSQSATSVPACSNAAFSAAALGRISPRGARFSCAILLATATGLLGGCADGDFNMSLDETVQKLIKPQRTPQQHALVAFADTDPDQRREAIAKVADSKQSDQNWAIRSYTTIALLETDSQTRCVAVRALAQTRDPAAAVTCLKLVNHRDFPAAEVRPPDDVTRWEAVAALAALSRDGAAGAEQASAIRDALIQRLTLDTDRNVRSAAARGLANYPDVDVLAALVAALHDEDFGVAYECELSLQQLTGQSFACDARAWQAWIESHQSAPFAAAGALDPRKPKFDTRVERDWHDTKQVVRWLFPPQKPK